MESSSFFLKSKRFWGMFITAATAVLPAVGVFFGWDIKPGLIMDLGDAGNVLFGAVGGFIGLVLTLVGSMKAKGPMVLLPE